MLTSDTPVRPHPSVVFTRLDAAEAVLLHLGTKRYYSLNETGHALTKEGQVPPADIERAIRRKDAFTQDPEKHSYEEELQHGEDERRTQNPRSDDRR